jgi:RAT1-interacting protein
VRLKKKSGVVEVRKVGEGHGKIVSEEFLGWRGKGKEKEGEEEDGEEKKDEIAETA